MASSRSIHSFKLTADFPRCIDQGLGIRLLRSRLARRTACGVELSLRGCENSLGRSCNFLFVTFAPPSSLAVSYACTRFGLSRISMLTRWRAQPVCTSNRQLDSNAIEASRILSRWNTISGTYSMKFSMYGNRGAQTEVKGLTRAKFLTITRSSPFSCSE